MLAEFYLINSSFRYEEGRLKEDIEEAIEKLSDDIEYIREYKDKILKHSSIYEEYIYAGYQILDLYTDKPCPLSRNVKKFLLKVIDHNNETSWSNEEITELINEQENEPLNEDNSLYGLIALFKSSGLEITQENYIIHNKRNWLDFHRYFLGKYPFSEQYFLTEAKKCFPMLYFHERCQLTLSTLENNWKDFTITLVYHLSCLSDKFPKYKAIENYQRIEVLKAFGSECNIEVTPQGNLEDKPLMTFEFEDQSGNKERICCEPHMKLSKSDKSGDSIHYFNRIYFHEGKDNIQDNKILIGHIGKHIYFKK